VYHVNMYRGDKKGKLKGPVRITMSFPDREALPITEKKALGRTKVTTVKFSAAVLPEASMRLPGAFEIDCPDLPKDMIFTSPEHRDIILALLILYCHGFSMLKRMS